MQVSLAATVLRGQDVCSRGGGEAFQEELLSFVGRWCRSSTQPVQVESSVGMPALLQEGGVLKHREL